MSETYDLIVIGAGHNGLVAATLAARRGRKVLVLEARHTIGGLCAGEEFVPGFRHAGILHETSGLRPRVVAALDLAEHGLRRRDELAPVFAVEPIAGGSAVAGGGRPASARRGLLLWRDAARAADELAARQPSDAAAYDAFRAAVGHYAPLLRGVFDEFPPELASGSIAGRLGLLRKAAALRMLGKTQMLELLRILPLSASDWLGEWFHDELLSACLALPAVLSTYTGPRSPGSACNLLLAECLAAPQVIGGPQAVTAALAAAARAAGVTVRMQAAVRRIEVAAGAVRGVRLADGERLAADVVAAACDPKTLWLKLLEPTALSRELARDARNIRARGTTAKLHLALRRYPGWSCRPDLQAAYVRIAPSLTAIERAFDAVKYRQQSREPVLDLYVPTLEAPELAPAGQHVLSILVSFAPHALDGGWDDAAKSELLAATMRQLEAHAPGLSADVVGSEVLSPLDLEQRYGLWGGQLHHGEHALDQLLLRPTARCARYATEVAGLYLVGSGAHPGGGVTGAPGYFADMAVCRGGVS